MRLGLSRVEEQEGEGRQGEDPVPIVAAELAGLKAQWDCEPEWGAGLNPLHGSGDESLLGSLLVRDEVAQQQTDELCRDLYRARSDAADWQSQARHYRQALEDLEREHEQMQSSTSALLQMNADLFSETEATKAILSTFTARALANHLRLIQKCLTLDKGGRAWRAWRGEIYRQRRSNAVLHIISKRRQTHAVRSWMNAASHDFWCERRERRNKSVLLAILKRRARNWRRLVLRTWRLRRIQSVTLLRRCQAKTWWILRQCLQLWAGKASLAPTIRSLLGSVLIRSAGKSAFTSWRQGLAGKCRTRVRDIAQKAIMRWSLRCRRSKAAKVATEWFNGRRIRWLMRGVVRGWLFESKRSGDLATIVHRAKTRQALSLFRAALRAFRSCVKSACRMKRLVGILLRRLAWRRRRCCAVVFVLLRTNRQKRLRAARMAQCLRVSTASRVVVAWNLQSRRARELVHRRKLLRDRQRFTRAQDAWDPWRRSIEQTRTSRQVAHLLVKMNHELLKAAFTVMIVSAKRARLLIQMGKFFSRQAHRFTLELCRMCFSAWSSYNVHCQSIWQARQQQLDLKASTLHLLLWIQWVQRKVSRRHISHSIQCDRSFELVSRVFLALKYAASEGGPTRSKPGVFCSANQLAGDGRRGSRERHKIEQDDSHPAEDESSLSAGKVTQERPSAFTIVVPSLARDTV